MKATERIGYPKRCHIGVSPASGAGSGAFMRRGHINPIKATPLCLLERAMEMPMIKENVGEPDPELISDRMLELRRQALADSLTDEAEAERSGVTRHRSRP